MTISIFDVFSIGVGPSSSHTIGPMRAANLFIDELRKQHETTSVNKIIVDLYGSLALTGKGHCTDYAVIMGLERNSPETIDPEQSQKRYSEILATNLLNFAGSHCIDFIYDQDLVFHYSKVLPYHANGMCITAFDHQNRQLLAKIYYSVGGGFVVDEEHYTGNMADVNTVTSDLEPRKQPYPFNTAAALLKHCEDNDKSMAEILFANELIYKTADEVKSGILDIWHVMNDCIERGLKTTGELPGGLKVPRRAAALFNKLQSINQQQPHFNNDINWLSLYAIAVNEENAAGGKVVTAPTNGAAGTIPSVLKFYTEYNKNCKDEKIIEFLLTAAAIGILYKEKASISAAEVGCQGEVGVACSMAAAAYAAVLGGNIYQVENAAEIGMEHNLGMTCDPIGGLVQIPCIERNAAGAVQAINAAQLALLGDGKHYVSLDKVIATMRETGRDMMSKYKETSQGGLAVNLPEC